MREIELSFNNDRLGFVEKSIQRCFEKGFSFERTQNLIQDWNKSCDNGISESQIEDLLLKIYTPRPEEEVPQFEPIDAARIIRILDLTIVRDAINKLLTFLCMLSAYTDNSQYNVSLNGPSSTGKTYIPLEIDRLFPEEDVLELGYCSPTAFFHDYGIWDKEKRLSIVDLSRKIIVFLDQPHNGLLERLRPLLSHDRREIQSKITDRREKHGMRTKNILIRGFPSVIFCTAGLRIDEQEGTRFLLLSPETSQEKIRESISMKIRKETDPKRYEEELEANPVRQLLKRRIRAIRNAKIQEINLHDPGKVEKMFLDRSSRLIPRHSRDMGRIINIVKAMALLNLWFRERQGANILTNTQDIEEAFIIWDYVFESQELGLPPHVLDIYKQVLVPLWKEKNGPVSRNELLRKHYQVFRRSFPQYQLGQEILPMLQRAGLIIEEPDPNIKRRLLIHDTLRHDD